MGNNCGDLVLCCIASVNVKCFFPFNLQKSSLNSNLFQSLWQNYNVFKSTTYKNTYQNRFYQVRSATYVLTPLLSDRSLARLCKSHNPLIFTTFQQCWDTSVCFNRLNREVSAMWRKMNYLYPLLLPHQRAGKPFSPKFGEVVGGVEGGVASHQATPVSLAPTCQNQ